MQVNMYMYASCIEENARNSFSSHISSVHTRGGPRARKGNPWSRDSGIENCTTRAFSARDDASQIHREVQGLGRAKIRRSEDQRISGSVDARRRRFRFDGLPLLLFFARLGVLVLGRCTLKLCMEYRVHTSSSLVVGS
jgi:hypothetical protein